MLLILLSGFFSIGSSICQICLEEFTRSNPSVDLDELEAKAIFKGASGGFAFKHVHESCYNCWSRHNPRITTLLHFIYLRGVLELLASEHNLQKALLIRLNCPTNEFSNEFQLLLDNPQKEILCEEKLIIISILELFEKQEFFVSIGQRLNNPFRTEKDIFLCFLELFTKYWYPKLEDFLTGTTSPSTTNQNRKRVFLQTEDFTASSKFRLCRRLEVVMSILFILDAESPSSKFRDSLLANTDVLVAGIRKIGDSSTSFHSFVSKYDRAPFTSETSLLGLRLGIREVSADHLQILNKAVLPSQEFLSLFFLGVLLQISILISIKFAEFMFNV